MKQRRRWYALLTVAAAVVVSFVVLEIGVRVYKRDIAFQPDPDLIRSLRPDVTSAVYSYETDDLLNSRTDEIPTRPTFKGMDFTNNVGLRMKDDVGPKAAGERRILLLGDSFVEASSVPDGQRFYKLLNDRLRLERGNGRWRVINAAIMNGTPSQYILQLRRYLDQFQPDVVIAFLAPNDILEDCAFDRMYGYARDEQGCPVGVRNRFQLWLLQKSWALRYFETALRQIAPNVRDVLFPLNDAALTCPDWVKLLCGGDVAVQNIYRQTTERYLVKLKEMSEARDARFGAFLIHYEWEFDYEPWGGARSSLLPEWATVLDNCDRNHVGEYRRFVHALLAQHDIDFWDPYEAIVTAKHENPSRKLWNYHDYHFSPAGHSLMGEAMFAFWKRLTK